MTTNAKTAKTTAKKARCKMATPISNDRAEAFVGPQAAVRPRFSEVPSERDKRAFEMQAHRMTQREIAKHLGCSQSTVHRAILKYRRWFGSTLPEDRVIARGIVEEIQSALAEAGQPERAAQITMEYLGWT